jgi:hypothetical protein
MRARELPGLLVVVVQLAELPGIHAELVRHLNMSVWQFVALARVDPRLQVLRDALLSHGRLSRACPVAVRLDPLGPGR